jgi:predicted methyltransferase
MRIDNYDSDYRVRAARNKNGLSNIDKNAMTATVVLFDENGDDIIERVPIVFAVCPTCDGRGIHVNPSIDCNGLTRDDFDEDPDFLNEYLGGMYDVTCYECDGNNVVPIIDEHLCNPEILARIRKQQEDENEFRALQESERRYGA